MQSSGPMPSRSATPGRNTSMTTSARAASRTNTAAPSGDLRSRPIARLPRCIALPAGRERSTARATSARSIRSTSAPRSARSMPQKGPGPSPVISRTRVPASGPVIARSARSRVEFGRLEPALGDGHEDGLALGDQLAADRRPPGDERLALLDAVDPPLVADLLMKRHRFAVPDGEGAGEPGALDHRGRGAEHHVEACGDDPAVHAARWTFVDVGVGDGRDRAVA